MNDQQRIETAADNCEVLRARLAKYEGADGNPKAQPRGVVLPELNKSREQWARVDARACARNNRTAANMFLIQDAQEDIERLHRALNEFARLNKPASTGKTLPHWEPCNPSCDPDFNGQRSMECAQLCRPAREALSASAGDERGHDTKGSRKALGAMNAKLRARVGALEHARLFIRNGIDLGCIRMPDADIRQCIAEELAEWTGDHRLAVTRAMEDLSARIDAKLASLSAKP